MDPLTKTATSSAPRASTPPDYGGALWQRFAESTNFSDSGLFAFLQTTWSIYTIAAYLVSFLLLYIFIYASIRRSHAIQASNELLAAEEEAWRIAHGVSTQVSHWESLQAHTESVNPNDWKLAIIEADIMLDEALKRKGFAGTSLGERLKGITSQTLQTIDEAWTAHKVRNQIAHGSADFVLTQKITRDTIARYRRVLEELQVI